MKTLGLLGGMSWESSIEYERLINQGIRARLGGLASADLVIRSFNFAEIEKLQAAGEWEQAAQLLAAAAQALEAAGAKAIVLCTNTMHKVAGEIEAAISIPLIHIAEATATEILRRKVTRVLLLGTRFTMQEQFYVERLVARGIEVVIPVAADQQVINQVIYDELVQGIISASSKQAYLEIISRYESQGIQGVIAGCTEIELLVHAADMKLEFFPTTAIHAQAAVDFALGS